MKKIYVFLFLVTPVISTSGMEIERKAKSLFPKDPYTNSTNKPLTVINTNRYNNASGYTEANEPGWEVYDAIMNIPYFKNAPLTPNNELELKPIYRPETTSTNNSKETKQPFLNALKPGESSADLMEKLYSHAYTRIIKYYKENTAKRNGIIKDSDLPALISMMNDAKTNTINEDMMAKYAYDKSSFFTLYERHTALAFASLKKYFLTIKNTLEQIPTCSDCSNFTTLAQYPAYMALADSLINIIWANHNDIHNCVSFLYSDQKNLALATYQDLKNEFYTKAADLFISPQYIAICELLQIIDQAKEVGDIRDEIDLGYAIIRLQKESLTTDFLTLFNEKYSPLKIKNCASIFCALAKEYNEKRGDKITPTSQQFQCWIKLNQIKIPSPDNFNPTLLDEQQYALLELDSLVVNMLEVINSDQQSIQNRANELYPPRK